VLLGLLARQRYHPSFGFRRNRRLLARSGSVIECCQRAIGHRPLHTTLDRLMMDAQSLPHRKERGILPVSEQYLRPLHPPRRLAARAPRGGPRLNFLVAHSDLVRPPPSCHEVTRRSTKPERGIHERVTGS